MIKRRDFIKTAALSSAALALPIETFAKEKVQFDLASDTYIHINGTVTEARNPIANVVVSDGETVVTTDSKGRYEFITKNRFVFISVPSGYKIPVSKKGTAQFYKEIDRQKKNSFYPFELEKSAGDNEHSFIVFADPQTLDQDDMKKFHTETIPDLQKTLMDEKLQNAFGVSVGDIMYDRLELYPQYENAVEKTGIPFFQVFGNHDAEVKTKTDEQSEKTFTDYFGPTYYSFNRGKVHYVVLDDIFWFGTYMGYLNQRQLDWLRKDLSFVEKGARVVVFMHIPPFTTQYLRYENEKPSDKTRVVNKELLYEILKPFNSLIICGHTHESEYIKDGEQDIHVCGAVCGAWWTGPVCHDGTPKGYSIYKVNGDNISWQYKSTGLPSDHQFEIYPPRSEFNETDELIVNIWAFDDGWKAQWFEDGTLKGGLEKRTSSFDPQTVKLYKGDTLPAKHTWVEPLKNNHMFFAKPGAAAKTITVTVTNKWGRVYSKSIDL